MHRLEIQDKALRRDKARPYNPDREHRRECLKAERVPEDTEEAGGRGAEILICNKC